MFSDSFGEESSSLSTLLKVGWMWCSSFTYSYLVDFFYAKDLWEANPLKPLYEDCILW